MDVHPTKNVSIGIDPYPYGNHGENHGKIMEKSEQEIIGFFVKILGKSCEDLGNDVKITGSLSPKNMQKI